MKALLAILLLAPGLARADAAADAQQKALDAVVAAGFSRTAALDRVQEWQAKGADPAKILELLGSLRQAALDGTEALREDKLEPTPALIEAAASARLSGVGTSELASALYESRSADEAQSRCLAVSTLALSGVAVRPAAELVALAGQRGYQRADLGELVGAVQRLLREQPGPREAVLQELGSAVRRGARPTELYPAVIQALGAARPGREAGFNRTPHSGH